MADKSSDSCAFLLLVGIHRPVFFVTEQLYGPGPTRLRHPTRCALSTLTRSTPSSRLQLIQPVPLTPDPYLYVQPGEATQQLLTSPVLPTSQQLGNTTLALPLTALSSPVSCTAQVPFTCLS